MMFHWSKAEIISKLPWQYYMKISCCRMESYTRTRPDGNHEKTQQTTTAPVYHRKQRSLLVHTLTSSTAAYLLALGCGTLLAFFLLVILFFKEVLFTAPGTMLDLEVAHLIAETGGETISDTDSGLGAAIVHTVELRQETCAKPL